MKTMTQSNIAMPKIVSQAEWLEARLKLLDQEKELTREYDRVNAERRRLPMVKVEKDYFFEGPEGKKSLAMLFGTNRQLIIYHFMFDPEWMEGCSGCTGYVDAIADLSLLGQRDTAFAIVSRALLPKLEAYKASKGWNVAWYSSFGSDFNYDFHVTLNANVQPVEYNYRSEAQMNRPLSGEEHGVSVFFRDGADVYHTYSTYARGTEALTDTYRLLDTTPYGRQEDFEVSPAGWPQKPTYG